MIYFDLLLLLFISNPDRLMMPTGICDCVDATLTISPTKDIDMVQVSWSFYNSEVDHSTVALNISILHGCWVLESFIPFLVLLYHFRLLSMNSLFIIFRITFPYQMY